jgi:hypothetical protein
MNGTEGVNFKSRMTQSTRAPEDPAWRAEERERKTFTKSIKVMTAQNSHQKHHNHLAEEEEEEEEEEESSGSGDASTHMYAQGEHHCHVQSQILMYITLGNCLLISRGRECLPRVASTGGGGGGGGGRGRCTEKMAISNSRGRWQKRADTRLVGRGTEKETGCE